MTTAGATAILSGTSLSSPAVSATISQSYGTRGKISPMKSLLKNKSVWIVALSAAGIVSYFLPLTRDIRESLLIAVIIVGGLPMIYDVIKELLHGELGADALAVVSIITSFVLKQYLAGSIIVLMLSGGVLLETYAVHSASSVLDALLKRLPTVAHRQVGPQITDIV